MDGRGIFQGRGPLSLYPMGTRGSFPGDKVAGEWSWPLISMKNVWSYTSTPPIRLHGVVLIWKHMDFTFYTSMLLREWGKLQKFLDYPVNGSKDLV